MFSISITDMIFLILILAALGLIIYDLLDKRKRGRDSTGGHDGPSHDNGSGSGSGGDKPSDGGAMFDYNESNRNIVRDVKADEPKPIAKLIKSDDNIFDGITIERLPSEEAGQEDDSQDKASG